MTVTFRLPVGGFQGIRRLSAGYRSGYVEAQPARSWHEVKGRPSGQICHDRVDTPVSG